VAYIVVDVDVFVVMKYSVIQMVFIVETYVRKKSYKKCHSRFSWCFDSVQNKCCPQKSRFLNWYCEAASSGEDELVYFRDETA